MGGTVVRALMPCRASIAGEVMGAEPKTAGGLRWIALVAIVVGLLAPSPDTYGAGELDPTFDGDGKLTTDFGAEEGAADVAVQPDGKIVAAGSSSISTIDPYDFALDRYNPDGSLDTTFSGDGRVITNFGSSDSLVPLRSKPTARSWSPALPVVAISPSPVTTRTEGWIRPSTATGR